MYFSRMSTTLATSLALLVTATHAQHNSLDWCNDRGQVCFTYTESDCNGSCPPGFRETGRGRKFSCGMGTGTYAECQAEVDCREGGRRCDRPLADTGGCVYSLDQCPGREQRYLGHRHDWLSSSFSVTDDYVDFYSEQVFTPSRDEENKESGPSDMPKVADHGGVGADFQELVATLKQLEALVEAPEDAGEELAQDAAQDRASREVEDVLELTYEQVRQAGSTTTGELASTTGRRQAGGSFGWQEGFCCPVTYRHPYCMPHPLHLYQCHEFEGYSYDHSKRSSGSGCWWGFGRGYCTNPCGGGRSATGECVPKEYKPKY